MIEFKKILHPTDFSDFSDFSKDYVISQAIKYNAEVTLLYVVENIPFPTYLDMYNTRVEEVYKDLKKHAMETLDEIGKEYEKNNIKIKKVILTGIPFEEIIKYANEEEVDLIIMGTHGRSALGHILMGSVAEKVVRKAPCPVLICRHPDTKFKIHK